MDSAEKQRNYALADRLLSEQNFAAAAIAGAIAMILSAGIFGLIKSVSDGPWYSISGAGIGIMIGFAMQYLGRGIGWKYSLVAAVYAILGCLLGNLFAVVMDVAQAIAVSPLDVFANTAYSTLYEWMFKNASIADQMFWLIGIGSAAYFATRPLTREQGLALHIYKMRP
ncbi:MAG: hypothetical protein KJO82_05140 [Gammaproteobacteria bacterium]|nr:hypothetical protein [Gammaproteobacteria bacterium]